MIMNRNYAQAPFSLTASTEEQGARGPRRAGKTVPTAKATSDEERLTAHTSDQRGDIAGNRNFQAVEDPGHPQFHHQPGVKSGPLRKRSSRPGIRLLIDRGALGLCPIKVPSLPREPSSDLIVMDRSDSSLPTADAVHALHGFWPSLVQRIPTTRNVPFSTGTPNCDSCMSPSDPRPSPG